MASGQTLGFIGCGNMGGAVLNGLLNAAFSSNTDKEKSEEPPISHIIVCTKTEASAARIKSTLSPEHKDLIKVVFDQNVQTMWESDIIILGCKPYMAPAVLGEKGAAAALAGKLVISMLGGQSASAITNLINPTPTSASPAPHVIVAVPSMGAQLGQSMTIIETPEPTVPRDLAAMADWIFEQVGEVKYLGAEHVGLATVLVGATMATMTIPIEGLLDGCVAEGLKRGDAMELVLQGVKGLLAVLQSGQHPAVVRESISSPKGCTIQTLLSLEKAGTRSDFSEAIVMGNTHLREKM
ncbi:NADP oxidoreductase coenzyme F420-dependent [Penicillium bovifimosum]|uniref:NADP oxidoreductase coenzyme F420-dependent n=1 Tax=Penicillium bovifimosum TaxID=126998 RepID=A0A9W9L8B6_9EURO|nr:NADP oxidoreductase coenzyme F420-dependent [Penicillium bovifimosum]KAJ5142728.1 NADP oxidoreductase coenzyme F420-dependent [Penicillium bovifimosum]